MRRSRKVNTRRSPQPGLADNFTSRFHAVCADYPDCLRMLIPDALPKAYPDSRRPQAATVTWRDYQRQPGPSLRGLIPCAYPDDASTGLIIGNGHENKRRTVQASAVPAGKEGLGGVAQRAVSRAGRKWLDDTELATTVSTRPIPCSTSQFARRCVCGETAPSRDAASLNACPASARQFASRSVTASVW